MNARETSARAAVALIAVLCAGFPASASKVVDGDVVVTDGNVRAYLSDALVVRKDATLRFRTERALTLDKPISGAGRIVFDCGAPVTVKGNNLDFDGEMRIVRGEVKFLHDIFKYDDYAPSPVGGTNASVVIDNSAGTGSRAVFESKMKSPYHEFKCYAGISLLEGERRRVEAAVETRGPRNFTLYGDFSVRGSATVLADANFTFAGRVDVTGGDVDFVLSQEACAARKFFTFSGPSSSFSGRLRSSKGNVALRGPLTAPGGVSVAGTLEADIVAKAPGGVFFDGDHPTFRRTCSQAAPDGTSYTLTDWSGKELAAGNWPKGDVLELPVRRRGYYWLTTSASNSVSFAVVPRPESRLMNPDSPFGAVAELARFARFDCPWMNGDACEHTQRLLAWAGISWVRNYFYLPGPSTRDPLAYIDAAAARTRLYERMRVNVCTVVPGYNQKNGLADVYRQWKRAAERFGTSVKAWEDLNEREAHDTSWETATHVKVAYLALKAACPSALLTSPSHEYPRRSRYDDGLYENDLAKYIDFLNYHFYGSLQMFPTVEAMIRRQLLKHGISDRDMWITERGSNVEATGRDRPSGRFDRFAAHDRDQELGVAEFFPKMYLRHLMVGGRRVFAFIFNPFAEQKGAKDWSFAMRRDGTVKPGYASVSTMIQELDGCRFLREYQVIRPLGSIRAYLFERPDGTTTLAYWSCSECDLELLGHNCFRKPTREERWFSIKPVPGSYRNVDMCGGESVIKTHKGHLTLKATRFPQYVTGLKGIPKIGGFCPLPHGGPVDVPFAADEDPTLVVSARADSRDFLRRMDKAGGYPVRLTNAVGRISFEVWNLSEKPKEGRIEAVGCRLGGLPRGIVKFPPMGKFPFVGTISKSDFPERGEVAVSIRATAAGKRSTRFVMPLLAQEAP